MSAREVLTHARKLTKAPCSPHLRDVMHNNNFKLNINSLPHCNNKSNIYYTTVQHHGKIFHYFIPHHIYTMYKKSQSSILPICASTHTLCNQRSVLLFCVNILPISCPNPRHFCFPRFSLWVFSSICSISASFQTLPRTTFSVFSISLVCF